MKPLATLPLALVAAALLVPSARATTITFGFDPVPGNNTDLAPDVGSFAAANGNGWITDDGTGPTPNIGITWAPTGGTDAEMTANVLDIHSSVTFSGAGFEVPILQLDTERPGEANPSITFSVSGGYALQLHGLLIGNATDQSEAPYGWTLNLVRLTDMTTVASHATALLGPGDLETVSFGFTGETDVSYQLVFDRGDSNFLRTAIDNISFSQVQVPEASTASLAGLAALGLLRRRR